MSSVFKQFSKSLLDAATRKEFLETLGQFVRDRIKVRTRLGKGVVDSGGKQASFKPLSPGYKKTRVSLKKSGRLSELTTPARSNLTKTGRMINSIRYQVIDKKIEVFVTEAEQAKAKGNAELGRVFLNISDKDLKELKTKVIAQLAKALKSK